jgi:hypothetical protein
MEVSMPQFRRSNSCDTSACIEVSTPQFRRSTSCGNGAACVEVALGSDVLVRDSKDPDGPVLSFSSESWGEFLRWLKTGAFDLRRS